MQNIESLNGFITENMIDIVLMDINLGKLSKYDGLDIASNLKKEFPSLNIIMLTGYDLPVYRYKAKKIGINGFLNKNINPEKLLEALLMVSHGHTYIPFDNKEIMVEELTYMEKNILSLISYGKKRKEIAQDLYISERTLSNHLQHIYEKLDVTSSVEAITKALKMGYITPSY